mgnify:CR=1 FL=1
MFIPANNRQGYVYQPCFKLDTFKALILREVPEKFQQDVLQKYPFEEYFNLQVEIGSIYHQYSLFSRML